MKGKGGLYVISGPSGVGKGTVCAELVKRKPDCFLSVSATSRAPREGEVDGVHYYFKTKEEFDRMVKNDEFLEYANYVTSSYGTPKAPCLAQIEAGNDVILEIEVQGGMNVKEKYPDTKLIFVVPPVMDELKSRLIGRGTETEDVITKRLNRAKEELEIIDKYDYIVVNDTVENAVANIEAIMTANRFKSKNILDIVKKELEL